MKFDASKSIWYERYKPQTVEDLILPQSLKEKFLNYVKNEDIPNLGFFSTIPGLGKSSTSHALIKDLGSEALWINASMENGIDVLRGKIAKFASSNSFNDKIKIVVMDEFDNFTHSGQTAFRGFIDEFSQNCRFIFTGNYKEKIIQPLLDRLEIYDFSTFPKQEMVKQIAERLKFILDNEKIQYEPKQLVPIINTYYPKIRSMIGALQKFSKNGVLTFEEGDLDDLNVFDKILQLLKQKAYFDMVTEVNKLNAPDNMYTFLYKHGVKYFDESKYPNVVLIIAKYQHMSEMVRDKNLNLAACLTELMKLV